MSAINEGMPLSVTNGQIDPFLAKQKRGLFLIFGTGTLTLSYSLDGEHWDDDTKTYDIANGAINIEADFVRYAYYKVTTTGAITSALIKYD